MSENKLVGAGAVSPRARSLIMARGLTIGGKASPIPYPTDGMEFYLDAKQCGLDVGYLYTGMTANAVVGGSLSLGLYDKSRKDSDTSYYDGNCVKISDGGAAYERNAYNGVKRLISEIGPTRLSGDKTFVMVYKRYGGPGQDRSAGRYFGAPGAVIDVPRAYWNDSCTVYYNGNKYTSSIVGGQGQNAHFWNVEHGSPSIALGQYALVVAGDGITEYKNGAKGRFYPLSEFQKTEGVQPTENFQIFRHYGDATDTYTTLAYSRALTDDEMAKIYAVDKARFNLP